MKLSNNTGGLAAYAGSRAGAIRMHEGTGFKYLDYSMPGADECSEAGGWEKVTHEVGEAAAACSLKLVQAHAPEYNPLIYPGNAEYHEKGMTHMLHSIEACGMLGIPNVVVHAGYSLDYRYPQDRDAYFEINRDFYRKLYGVMEKWNVRVCIENSSEGNMKGRYTFMTPDEMNDFLDYCDHPLMGGCWDFGHGHMRGTVPYDDIMGMGKNLTVIHVHDNFGEKDEHQPLFFGSIDVDSIMRGLIDVGYTGYFNFESVGFLGYRKDHGSDRLQKVPLSVRKEALRLQYQIGRACLEAYGLYEE